MTQKAGQKSVLQINSGYRGFWYLILFLIIAGLSLWGFHYYQDFFQSNVMTGDSHLIIFIFIQERISVLEKMICDQHCLRDIIPLSGYVKEKNTMCRSGRDGIRSLKG